MGDVFGARPGGGRPVVRNAIAGHTGCRWLPLRAGNFNYETENNDDREKSKKRKPEEDQLSLPVLITAVQINSNIPFIDYGNFTNAPGFFPG